MCNYGISFKNTKTNLVPSFLPALSSSTCIISLANQYNTSVDAAIAPGGKSEFQVNGLEAPSAFFGKKKKV